VRYLKELENEKWGRETLNKSWGLNIKKGEGVSDADELTRSRAKLFLKVWEEKERARECGDEEVLAFIADERERLRGGGRGAG